MQFVSHFIHSNKVKLNYIYFTFNEQSNWRQKLLWQKNVENRMHGVENGFSFLYKREREGVKGETMKLNKNDDVKNCLFTPLIPPLSINRADGFNACFFIA